MRIEENSPDVYFPNMGVKAEKLLSKIKDYSFYDLAVAIFTITSWRNNRSAQESCLALNMALIHKDKFGTKKLDTYSKFLRFFDKIKKILKISYYDDPVLNDFGEIKLSYDGAFYPVITGTGHTSSVFTVLQFLENVSSALGVQEQTKSILAYVQEMINYLGPTNISAAEESPVTFECPQEGHYNAVKKFFTDSVWGLLGESSINIFSAGNNPVVRTHFVKKNDITYPLFNPSLISDYYTYLLGSLSPRLANSTATLSLVDKLRKIYVCGRTNSDIVFNNYRICNGKTPYHDIIPGFIFSTSDLTVFFMDCSVIELDIVNSKIKIIEKLHKTGKLGILGLDAPIMHKGYMGFRIPKENDIHFILYEDYTNLDETHLSFGSQGERAVYTAIDLMGIFMFADNVKQLVEFDRFSTSQSTQILSWGGNLDYFLLWYEEHGHITKGANRITNINLGIDTAASIIYEKYIQLDTCFPFHLPNSPMGIPEEWNIALDDNGIYQFSKKSKKMIGGSVFILDNGCSIFLSYDFLSILKGQNTQEIKHYRDFISGIFERFIIEFAPSLSYIKLLDNFFIQFECKSLITALEDGYVKVLNKKGSANNLYISYSVDTLNIMRDIADCKNRSVEYGMITQLILPLIEDNISEFKSFLDEISAKTPEKKTANAIIRQPDFYYNMNSMNIRLTDAALLSARKEIAHKAAEHDITPGKYTNKDATYIVREIQGAVVHHLEKIISGFDRLSLHMMLLSYFAYELFSIYANTTGYQITKEIDDIEKERSKDKMFHLSEESKEVQLALLYLIETNLFLTSMRKERIPMVSDIERLLALAHWLVILQNNSDLCFHTDSKTELVILDDFRIDVKLSQEYAGLAESIRRRFYESDIYSMKNTDKDKQYIDEICKGFEMDTGVNFLVLESVMKQLYECSFQKDATDFDEISPNVIRINKQDAIQDYAAYVLVKVEPAEVQKAYDFLTVIPEKLKSIGNKDHPILPIWEREKRDNRFQIRPLLAVGDSYIYSPIVIKELRNRWINGLMQFYLPYEIGLKNMLSSLRSCKEYYEQSFAFDTRDIFIKAGFAYAEANVDLRRNDRAGNHPPIHELGDYDVIALDTVRKMVFIIECKVLEPIGSIFEHSMQQIRFFQKKKFDERFQKRIDYLTKVYRSFFKNIGYDLHNDEYTIQPYMVVNKVFDSYYKEIQFPIVTLDELKKIVART